LGAYLHPFKNLGEGHHDPRIRVALFGFPLITAPYVALAFAAGIVWAHDPQALSWRSVLPTLMSCGASLTVSLAMMPLRSVRDLKDESVAQSRCPRPPPSKRPAGGRVSGEHVLDQPPMHVRQPALDAVVVEAQPLVV